MKSSENPKRAGRPPQIAQSTPLVYVIILNYNGATLTINCLNSVLRIDYPNFKVLIVDNASTDDSVTVLQKTFRHPSVELLVNSMNAGYAGGNNRGIERALGYGAEYVCVLNNDTTVEPACLTRLVEAMEGDSRLGIAGCPLLNADTESSPNFGQRMNLFTGTPSLFFGRTQPPHPSEVDFICGAAIFIRVEAVRQIGLFDARFFLLSEDADLCYRARRAGYKVGFYPGPGVCHLGSQTLNRHRPFVTFLRIRNKAWFVRRHGTRTHWLVFNFLSFFYFYPRTILGRLMRREYKLLHPVLKGIWEGHFGYPGLDISR